MNTKRNTTGLALWIIVAFFMVGRNAHAYLDPGTGSYILQIVIAGLLGVLFTAKVFWQNVKTFIFNLFSKERK